jgi:hypothetical protein
VIGDFSKSVGFAKFASSSSKSSSIISSGIVSATAVRLVSENWACRKGDKGEGSLDVGFLKWCSFGSCEDIVPGIAADSIIDLYDIPSVGLATLLEATLETVLCFVLPSLSSRATGEASRRSWPPGSAENAAFRPKNDLADHGVLGPLSDAADLTGFQSVSDGEVFNLASFGLGGVGGALGDRNLSAGFIVCIPGDMAPSEALLSRKGLI